MVITWLMLKRCKTVHSGTMAKMKARRKEMSSSGPNPEDGNQTSKRTSGKEGKPAVCVIHQEDNDLSKDDHLSCPTRQPESDKKRFEHAREKQSKRKLSASSRNGEKPKTKGCPWVSICLHTASAAQSESCTHLVDPPQRFHLKFTVSPSRCLHPRGS